MEQIAYLTNNIAPFRVSLLDELAKNAKVTLFYCYELEKGTNPKYVNKRPKAAQLVNIKKIGIFETLKKLLKMDYIIIDGYTGREKLILVFLLILCQKSYAVSIDGIIYRKDSSLKNIIKKIVLKNSKVVFSTNAASDKLIRNIYPRSNIKRQIFTTLYQEEKDKLLEQRLHYLENPSDSYILYVGKFIAIKGVREFVVATKDFSNKKIMIGGTVEELAQLGCAIDSSFEIIPFLEKDEVLSYMKKAKLFVLPTYDDPWGLVVVEAASVGGVVVTTTSCNAGVQLLRSGKNGYLAEKEDANELQEKIKKALELDERKVALFNKEFLKNYTLEQAALNMLATLRREL